MNLSKTEITGHILLDFSVIIDLEMERKSNLPAHPLPQTWEPHVKYRVGQVYWKDFRKVGTPYIIGADPYEK